MADRRWDEVENSPFPGGVSADGVPPLRLVVGLGDPECERELLPELSECGAFAIVERCLSADEVLACLERGRVDIALVSSDLHRLSAATLADLARARVPLVALARDPDEPRWQDLAGVVLPLEADPRAVREALVAAAHGRHSQPAIARTEPDTSLAELDQAPEGRSIALSPLVVTGGRGSPGRTTVALNLAVALGAVDPTVLVDIDLAGPSIAACLDADPTRNLYMLAHAEPSSPQEWERALAQETQPLGPRSPHGAVLCGVPKPQMRGVVSPRFLEQIVAELGQRYRYVVIDAGADLLGPQGAVQRAVLALAGQILLVARTDVVGLWHARTALELLERELGIPRERLALVVNGHDRHFHHGRAEIEWALGIPAAAVVPYDHAAAQRALAAQRPLLLDSRGPAARALLDLAERVHGGRVLLRPEKARGGMGVLGRLPLLGRAFAPSQPHGNGRKGVPGGRQAT
ncbi:MAG: hypothetical protein M1401_04150, partial [Chloroflexi bacterium]|nr:hypothetical protein [Chloroflexota bacterium]